MQVAGVIVTREQVTRIAVAWLAAVVVTYTLASLVQTLFMLTALTKAGGVIPPALWLHTLWHDFANLAFNGKYVSYGVSILQGFAIAMPVAAVLRRFSKLPGMVLYPLAGATAIATILYVYKLNFVGYILVTGTRGTWGLASQLLIGALGGAIFAMLCKPRSSP